MANRADLRLRVLEAMEIGILCLSSDLQQVLMTNRAADELLKAVPLSEIFDEIRTYVTSRRDTRTIPAPMRLERGELTIYLRIMEVAGAPPVEMVLLHREIVRDAEAFRVLSSRYQVSRREYQILTAVRMGKSNRQIAADLGLALSTIESNLQKLFHRFNVPNRTRLVSVMDQLLHRRF